MTNTKLRELREKTGLTQQQLADQIGVQREMVARWETKGGISKVYVNILNKFFNQK